MGRIAILVATLAIAIPSPHAAAGARASARHNPTKSVGKHVRPQGLAGATAAMKSLMRDRERRRYRHNWERAIGGLLAAAHGKDKAAAWLEAGRARYALYRWGANETDRDKALLLANRAARLGSREGKALASAIREEAGDDGVEVARPVKPARRSPRPAVAPTPERSPAPEEEDVEDSPPDPTLAAALADLAAPAPTPTLRLGEDRSQGPAEITEVRSWASGDYSRVAVYLSHWVGWQKLELAPEGGQPRRLAFDFRPAALTGKALTRSVAGGQIDRVRAAQNASDTVRVVLDLAGSDAAEVFALDDPPRLVVDVGTRPSPMPVAERPPERSPEPEAPLAVAPPSPTVPPAVERSGHEEEEGPRTVRRIVVDAGHGGHDPGAIGRRGLREKDVTLDIARKVAKELKGEGFEVVLTRSDDRFLQLEERTALANTSRGDLFVSIHANATPRRNRSGIETYFLNVTDDRYAARLAARENGADLDGGESDDVLKRIRADLDAVASAGSSHQLAALVQRELCSSVRSRFGDVRDLGVKSALFYVLLGARMPAVLVETGFISNAAEEKRLGSPAYRLEVAKAVTRAVRSFARSDERVAAVR
ncbi:MAG TPA: N-acetylmuramoyl-L-alanine amidase [Anaeromyxobacteraceae bacterium]|nr:N-acetylmuramoyl-L-alanine amidase [Anaeromyxobacteraceae bacterium]